MRCDSKRGYLTPGNRLERRRTMTVLCKRFPAVSFPERGSGGTGWTCLTSLPFYRQPRRWWRNLAFRLQTTGVTSASSVPCLVFILYHSRFRLTCGMKMWGW